MSVKLTEAQLREFPDSKILSATEALTQWTATKPLDPGASVFQLLEVCEKQKMILQWFRACFRQSLYFKRDIIFYECGFNEDTGVYLYRGCRNGTAPGDYISGFPN